MKTLFLALVTLVASFALGTVVVFAQTATPTPTPTAIPTPTTIVPSGAPVTGFGGLR